STPNRPRPYGSPGLSSDFPSELDEYWLTARVNPTIHGPGKAIRGRVGAALAVAQEGWLKFTLMGASPSVLQVANPTPSSETPTTSPNPITTLISRPCIHVDQSSLQFAGVAGQSDPVAQTVILTNCGDSGTWSGSPVTSGGANWLSVSPGGGSLNNGATQPVTVTASNLGAHLAAG